MNFKLPKNVTVVRQEAAAPFRPALLSIVPSDNLHGDAIAHIPLFDGVVIGDQEKQIADEIAIRWNAVTEAGGKQHSTERLLSVISHAEIALEEILKFIPWQCQSMPEIQHAVAALLLCQKKGAA